MESKLSQSTFIIFCLALVSLLLLSNNYIISQTNNNGLRGDSIAIADLESMVNTMGGLRIWSQLKSIHFVHRWYFWDRHCAYNRCHPHQRKQEGKFP